jgi:CHAT domain-containing protein
MMELLLAQGKTPEAFAYAERVKANRLVDVMESGGTRLTKTMTASEQQQERRLENQIISFKAQIARERERRDPEAQRLAALTDGLQKTQGDYRAFEAKLYAAHPLLKAARGESLLAKPEAPSARFDDPQSAMLEFIVTEGRTYLFTLAREQGSGAGGQGPDKKAEGGRRKAEANSDGAIHPSSFRLPPSSPAPVLQAYAVEMKRGELAARVAKFRELIDRRDEGAAQAAREVYDILLKQADEQIKNKSAWIIAPDSVLWQVPFQALQPAASRYVIEDHAISYAPSLAALNEIRKAKPPARVAPASQPVLLAFANPTIAPQTAERAKVTNKDEKLDGLPETENEVKALAQLYGAARSRVYVGAQAREQSAKEDAARFRVLHLAAPGVVGDVSPMYSHVALAQTVGKDDGLLEVWEMMQMNWHADLVVWSASETARAASGSGEGITGLGWSLFAAGCPTLVTSQWRTQSPGTTELMLAFHGQLQAASNRRERLTKAQALQQAILKLLKGENYKQPFYWAGFAMVGDGR